MTANTEDPDVRSWLDRLNWALASIPAAEREDIVAETRAHLAESIADGHSPRDALAHFGAAETYARTFLDDIELSGALGSQRAGAMLSVLARRVHKSLVAAFGFLLVLILGGTALGAVLTAAVKIVAPAYAGFFVGPRVFALGITDDPAHARELLGYWIFPVLAVILTLCWILGRMVLLWSLRTLAKAR